GLAFLAAYRFVFVADALTLVRFRLAGRPDLGRELADLLLVGALDDDRGRVGQLDGHAIGRGHRDGVGVPDGEDDRLLVHAGLVADALDLEALFVTRGDALDHVGDQAAGQAVQRAVETLVVGPRNDHGLLGLVVDDLHGAVRRQLELALRPLDVERAVVEPD